MPLIILIIFGFQLILSCVVIYRAKYLVSSVLEKPELFGPSLDAQKVCVVAKGGTVLKNDTF